MTNDSQKKVAQLQLFQQNLQALLVQKQQFQLQLNEAESALTELKGTQQAYKIIGSLMVLSDRGELEKGLKERKATAELRVKNIEMQEERLRKKADELQREIVQAMKKEGGES